MQYHSENQTGISLLLQCLKAKMKSLATFPLAQWPFRYMMLVCDQNIAPLSFSMVVSQTGTCSDNAQFVRCLSGPWCCCHESGITSFCWHLRSILSPVCQLTVLFAESFFIWGSLWQFQREGRSLVLCGGRKTGSRRIFGFLCSPLWLR